MALEALEGVERHAPLPEANPARAPQRRKIKEICLVAPRIARSGQTDKAAILLQELFGLYAVARDNVGRVATRPTSAIDAIPKQWSRLAWSLHAVSCRGEWGNLETGPSLAPPPRPHGG